MNSSSEALRPATCSRDPEILCHAKAYRKNNKEKIAMQFYSKSTTQNLPVFYMDNAKHHFKNATTFWKRKRDKNYIKLLHTTYHPLRIVSKFFKSINRIIQGIFLLIWAIFNKPTYSFPKILRGVGLECLALLINVFNIIFFLLTDVIRGIILGVIFNLIH